MVGIPGFTSFWCLPPGTSSYPYFARNTLIRSRLDTERPAISSRPNHGTSGSWPIGTTTQVVVLQLKRLRYIADASRHSVWSREGKAVASSIWQHSLCNSDSNGPSERNDSARLYPGGRVVNQVESWRLAAFLKSAGTERR